MSILLVHAAESEGDGLAACEHRRLCCGVGKAAAAAALQKELLERPASRVLIFGLCGAYPQRHYRRGNSLQVGELCLIAEDFLADEGVGLELGFRDIASMELGEIGPYRADAEWTAELAESLQLPSLRAATVSTCSGSEARSEELAARTGAVVESMEGAALAMVCEHAGIPWAQLRCVSNFCGDREHGHWDLEASLAKLREGMEAILHEL